jgi:hypothetical protein
MNELCTWEYKRHSYLVVYKDNNVFYSTYLLVYHVFYLSKSTTVLNVMWLGRDWCVRLNGRACTGMWPTIECHDRQVVSNVTGVKGGGRVEHEQRTE